MPGAGGRKLTQRMDDKKFEDDALFKEIGGQLQGSNFDYSEWQRTRRKAAAAPKKEAGFVVEKAPTDRTGASSSTGSTVQRRAVSAGSSCCNHRNQRKKYDPLYDPLADKKKAERIKIIQLRIQARRQTIEEYEKRKVQLLEDNVKLKEEIQGEEKDTHEEVKQLLRKYEKFTGGLTTLNDKSMRQMADVKGDLDLARSRVEADLAGLQAEVNQLDCLLQEKQTQLHVLANYKDKEYPVKALRISDLQKEMDQLNMTNQEEEADLQHVMETEIDKLRRDQQNVQWETTEKVTQVAIDTMHPSLKDMALQNMVMEKELAFHKAEVEELLGQNADIEAQVKAMLRDPKTNLRMQMFPEFFPTMEKCTPDMDVILDIPTQEWLPI